MKKTTDNCLPLVSVCIITYNQEKYIKKLLDSLLEQKVNFKFEIVIGEDDSTDNTRKIIEEYKNNEIILLKKENNLGAIKNFIRTLPHCRGKYIAFCEGDDYWIDSNKLQKQIDFLENNPEYGMVHTDADYLYQDTGKTIQAFNKLRGGKKLSGNIFNELFQENFLIHTASVCIKKNILETHLDFSIMKEKNWMLCDLAIWFEMSKHSQVKYFDDSTVVYRLLNESASRTNNHMRRYRFHQSVYSIKLYYWEKYSKDIRIKKMIDINFKKTQIGDAFNLNDKGMAKEAYSFLKTNKIKISYKKKLLYFSFHVFLLRSLIKFIKRINNK